MKQNSKNSIPEGWTKVSLNDLIKKHIISLERGRVISSDDLANNPGNYPVYSSSAQNNGLFGTFNQYDFDEELITWSVDGGGYFFYRPKHKFSVTNVAGILRLLSPKFNYRFLYYSLFFQHSTQHYDYTEKAHPSVIKDRYFIPDISLSEQQQIAAVLSAADQAIASTEELIAKYRNIKTGLLHNLLTCGIDKNGNIRSPKTHKFKQSPLGLIPQEWECETLGNLADFIGSGVTPKGGSEVYDKEGIMLIRSQNVYPDGFKLEDVAFISDKINNTMKRSELHELDVLLNITGASIGRSTFVPFNFPKSNVNQHVCAIRLKNPSEAKSIFVSVFLNSDYGQMQINKLNAGSNRQGLNYIQIRALKIPNFQSDAEIDNFAKIIKDIDKHITTLQTSVSKLRLQKAGLMSDLLSGKVRVTQLMNNNKNNAI